MTNEEMTMYNMRIKEERTKVEEAAFALFRLGKYEESKELLATLDSKPYMEEQRQQEPEGIPQMLTIKEAAEKTGISYEHIRQMCINGQLVHVKAGRKFLINAARLTEYLNKGEGATA